MIYLDNGATSMPKPACVLRAMTWAAEHLSSPGRGSSAASDRAGELLYELRMEAGAMFGCQPQQVVLTTSATHGLNIAIKSLVPPGGRAVISGMEHNAVVRPLYALGADVRVARGALFRRELLLRDFDRLLTPDTDACIVTHVSNVFGWILPLEEIAALCRERGVPLVVDAAQSAGTLDVSMERTGAAFIATAGHKGLLGPQGTGLLLCGHETRTLLEGGTGSVSRQREMPGFLPDRLEAGTQNMPGAAGLLAGIRYVRAMGLNTIAAGEAALRDLLVRRLRDLPGLTVYSGPDQTGTVSFVPEGRDTVLTAGALAEGFALRAGLHCAPLAHETAGTLETGTVRVSLGPHNRESDVERLTEALAEILAAAPEDGV